jgi:2-alkyl-3-oxoalkanoate reductase
MNKVLVTGANGFIGTALTKRLLHDGVAVRAMCRSLRNGQALAQAGAEVVAGDLQLKDTLLKAMRGCEVVFNVAAALGGSAAYQYNVSVLGSLNAVQAAHEVGVSRFVHVSSVAVYGPHLNGSISEDHPQQPARDDYYQQAKSIAETGLWEFAAQHAFPVTMIRPAMVYGPESGFWTLRLFNLLRRYPLPVIGDGNGTAHPIYINDVVDLLVTVAAHPAAPGLAFNCAPDPAPSWNDFLGHYARMAGNTRHLTVSKEVLSSIAPFVNLLTRMRGDPLDLVGFLNFLTRQFTYSMRRAEDKLNWRPRTSLAAGMAETERWLLQNEIVVRG